MLQTPCYTPLPHRTILWIRGSDATDFLQRLISNSMQKVTEKHSIYALMLTPQGKFLYDLFIIRHADGYLVDCYEPLHRALLGQWNLYKLRADVTITTEPHYQVYALWTDQFINTPGETIATANGYIFSDPRHAHMGHRAILNLNVLEYEYKLTICNNDIYNNFKYDITLPEGHMDMISGQSYPLDFTMDQFHAIDYQKGCYVGQEVTARMHYKGTPKKAPFTICSQQHEVLPPQGTDIQLSSGETIGMLCSTSQERGLALLKLGSIPTDGKVYAGKTPITITNL